MNGEENSTVVYVKRLRGKSKYSVMGPCTTDVHVTCVQTPGGKPPFLYPLHRSHRKVFRKRLRYSFVALADALCAC